MPQYNLKWFHPESYYVSPRKVLSRELLRILQYHDYTKSKCKPKLYPIEIRANQKIWGLAKANLSNAIHIFTAEENLYF